MKPILFKRANQVSNGECCRGHSRNVKRALPALFLASVVSGCTGSSAPISQTEVGQSSTLADPTVPTQVTSLVDVPEALLELQANETLKNPLPELSSVETLADSGLQIAYTDVEQSAVIPALDVEQNWLHMQSCLEQVGVAPLVLIQSGVISPFTDSDDVVFAMSGTPAASATMALVPVIQIGIADFMESGERYAYNLRSIMGRLLWSMSGLSVRNYPYSCAQEWEGSE